MKKLLSISFMVAALSASALFSLVANAGAEQIPDPLDGQAYVVNQGPGACPVGTFSQGVIDAKGRLIGTTCTVEGVGPNSMNGTPPTVIHSNSGGRCGAGGWEQGVLDWRGEFKGTICNYPGNSGGGN